MIFATIMRNEVTILPSRCSLSQNSARDWLVSNLLSIQRHPVQTRKRSKSYRRYHYLPDAHLTLEGTRQFRIGETPVRPAGVCLIIRVFLAAAGESAPPALSQKFPQA